MNDTEKLVNEVIVFAFVLIATPIVLGAVGSAIGYTYGVTANLVNRIKFNHEMNKEIKKGTVVKIDGNYYKVEPTVEA